MLKIAAEKMKDEGQTKSPQKRATSQKRAMQTKPLT
jgi:hypothetical protein